MSSRFLRFFLGRFPGVPPDAESAVRIRFPVSRSAFDSLAESLDQCMLFDQPRFRQRLRALQQTARAGKPIDQEVAQLRAQLDSSIARRRQRHAGLPRPAFPSDLPVVQRREDIAKAVAENQVVILCGETGSGKTTQLPKICLELGRGVAGMIGHTQPRRIAARSVALRIASELESSLGHAVGYKVRFNDKLSRDTYLKVMTDGILLAETQGDHDLLHYDTIIIDEAHERSLNIDFLLGYLKQLLPKRPELKLIITSATIDPQRFSKHFDNAPIIEVSGRTYPVEVRYRPVQAEEEDEEDPSVLGAILNAIDEVAAIDDGDILIFLSGEREIRETADALSRHYVIGPPLEVLPLYARLSTEDQNRVFEPHSGRRIILATNVAETSLTVPGIKFVIDPGYARISRYSANARVQRLPIEKISRASADQRKGRCGRIAAGVCMRLYSEDDYRDRSDFTDPEILRANLASVILQMKALKLGEIERFPFVEPPRWNMIREGYQTLHELGAVDDHGELTRIGSELARLPVDPRLGRMILAARDEHALHEVLIITAALATQDPRLRPVDAAQSADQIHQQFADERSDFLAYLKLWDFYHEQARHLSTNKLRKLCRDHFLSYVRLREWHDVHQQLLTLMTEAGMKLNAEPASYEDVHRSLLAGLLANVGNKGEAHEYLGVRDRKFHVFPGSVLFKEGPKWLVAAELVETTRLYARTVARLHPEWIEQLAEHVVKRTYTAPFWNAQSSHVEAYERITLQGLTIIPKRRVHYGRVNPDLARELFIQHALVEGDYRPPGGRHSEVAPFFQHNRGLIDEVRTLEAKSRRRDLMVASDVRYAFYDRRVPRTVFNGPLFEKWRRKAEQDNPTLLFMSRDDLLLGESHGVTAEQFPDRMTMQGTEFPLQYQLDPGQPADGVSLTVPLEALNLVSEQRAEWLVPGMLRDKVIALIKTLPKQLRVNFVPAPDYADSALKSLRIGEGNLLEQLSARLSAMSGTDVPVSAWDTDSLPDYLRMNFSIVDAEGKTLSAGRDLTSLKRELGDAAARQVATSLKSEFDRRHVVTWDFGDLPERQEVRRGGVTLFGYPAVIDHGQSVSLTLLDTPEAAQHASRGGIRRLFVLQVHEELVTHIEYLPDIDELSLQFAPFGTSDELKRDMIDLVADRVFLGDLPALRTQTDFERRLRSGWDQLWPAASEVSGLVGRILATHHQLDLQLSDADNPYWEGALRDIRTQLANLMPRHFLTETPFQWLVHVPRFLQAISHRLRKLANAGLSRDEQATAQVNEYWSRYQPRQERHRLHGIHDPGLEQFRWMIEELRVSLFAQELRTSLPVSAKRMESQWALVKP